MGDKIEIQVPVLYWIVAGKKGMELWGYERESDQKDWSPSKKPDVKVKIHPLHWDFEINQHDGSGRVRIGAGCQYNPLQMIEAMWIHLAEKDPADVVVEIDIDFANAEIEWNKSDTPFGENFSSDWE